MVTVVRGRPVSAQAMGSALFNLAWSCACSFQPAQSWPGWQQEKMGKGRGEGCSHLWEHRLRLNHWGLLVCSVRCMLGAGWGSVRHGWNGPTKTAPGCLQVRFFNICFCCPRFLILAVDVALWTCAVHPMKSCYGRGKDVYKINCQAFPMLLSLPPHHLLCCFFFPIVRERMKCLCYFQQRKHRSWSFTLVWAQESSLLKDVSTQEYFYMSISECGKACPEHQAHSGGCVNSSCSWTSEMNWACWCGCVCTSVLHFSSSAKHQRFHFSY